MRSAFYRSDSELLGWLEVGSSSADPIHLHVFRMQNTAHTIPRVFGQDANEQRQPWGENALLSGNWCLQGCWSKPCGGQGAGLANPTPTHPSFWVFLILRPSGQGKARRGFMGHVKLNEP